jgi:hypothetical protein
MPVVSRILAWVGVDRALRPPKALAICLALACSSGIAAASDTATPAQPYLSFSPAAVGIYSTTTQQLTASFSVTGTDVPTATIHYGYDYTAGAVTCTPSAGGQSCTVPVTFAPTLPGARKDALFLMDSTTLLATVYLGGVGLSPQALIQPGVITQLVSGSTYSLRPRTVSENGTVYLDIQSSAGSSNVYSLTPAGAMNNVPVTVNTSSAIAIDGAGTLYIISGDFNSQLTTWNTVTQTQGSLVVSPPSPFPCPNPDYLNAVTTDALANLFILENECQQVIELKSDGTYVTTAFDPPMDGTPNWMAVDSAGDVFFSSEDQVNELFASGSQSSLDIAGTGGGTTALDLDAAGSLYTIPIFAGDFLAELPAPNYQSVLAMLDPSVLPQIFTLGSDGTLYVGYLDRTSFNFNLDKVDRSQGSIDFGQQAGGIASAAQTAELYNGGNEPLIISSVAVIGSSLGFAIQPASSNNCSNGLVIEPGTLCQIAAILTPTQAGELTGSIVFTTNSLNNPNSTTTIALSGFVPGPNAALLPNPLVFGGLTVGTTSSPAVITLSNTGNQILTGIVASLDGTNPSEFAMTAGANACGSSLAAGSTCFFYVTFTPQAAIGYTAKLSLADNAFGSPQAAGLTGTGSSPAVILQIGEAIHTGDEVATTRSASLSIAEVIHTNDALLEAQSAVLNIAEAINTTDAPTPTPSVASLGIAEVIQTNDAPLEAQSAELNIVETIGTTDTPAPTASTASLQIAEVVDTADAVTEQALITTTQTVLSSSVNPSVAGQSVTFTALVSSTPPGAKRPAGTMQFSVNGTAAGTPVLLNAAGQALYSTSALPDGDSAVDAVYSGNGNFSSSAAAALTQSVVDFAFTASSTPSATILPGQSAAFSFAVSPQGTFGEDITFSVSGLPPGATASFSPPSLTPSAAPATVTLTIQTAETSAAVRSAWPATNTTLLLGMLLPLLSIRRTRRTLRSQTLFLVVLLSLGIATGLSSCGVGHLTQPPKTYPISVTATSGALHRSTTVNLTVR